MIPPVCVSAAMVSAAFEVKVAVPSTNTVAPLPILAEGVASVPFSKVPPVSETSPVSIAPPSLENVPPVTVTPPRTEPLLTTMPAELTPPESTTPALSNWPPERTFRLPAPPDRVVPAAVDTWPPEIVTPLVGTKAADSIDNDPPETETVFKSRVESGSVPVIVGSVVEPALIWMSSVLLDGATSPAQLVAVLQVLSVSPSQTKVACASARFGAIVIAATNAVLAKSKPRRWFAALAC